MHELGILVHIVRTVEKIAKENDVNEVTKISLNVGEVCGAMPEFLKMQFPLAINENPLFKNCELDIRLKVAKGKCTKCQKIYFLKANKGICPQCRHDDFVTISGTELTIQNITAI